MIRQQELRIPAGRVSVVADLTLPEAAEGVVLFAHGSGSSRFSPRNRFLAERLVHAGFATLLLDLLTPEEEAVDFRTAQYRFDVDLLASRVADVTHWLEQREATRSMRIAYFGASTGAAAALIAAARQPAKIAAVVSRGGRPDLAMESLPNVTAATLLIVGGADLTVVRMNRDAMPYLQCAKRLEIVERAGHLFDEPGALAEVARLATRWYAEYLQPVGTTAVT